MRSNGWLLALVGVVAFAGAFLGLRVERMISDTNSTETKQVVASPSVELRPVNFEHASFDEAAQAVPDFRNAARSLNASVVSVDRLNSQFNWLTDETIVAQTGTGSGVIIDAQGTIVTNNHVVQGAERVQVRLADDRVLNATVVGSDARSDIAVLKIEATGLKPAKLGESKSLEVGEWVIAIGNPLGYANTVSVGVVSSLNRTFTVGRQTVLIDAIQTDAAINQGNSGGALANAKGEVIGINSAIASNTGGGSIGIGFAIPIDRVRRVVRDIIEHGRVRYGVLGVSVDPRPGLLQNPSVRRYFETEIGTNAPRDGLVIREIGRGTAADQLGLKPFDILLELDQRTMTDVASMNVVLADKRPGDQVVLKYWQRGSVKTATVSLGS